MNKPFLSSILLFVLAVAPLWAQKKIATLQVEDLNVPGIDVPLAIPLNPGLIKPDAHYYLKEGKGSDEKISCQVKSGEQTELVFVFTSLSADNRLFSLYEAADGDGVPGLSSPGHMQTNLNDTTIVIQKNDQELVHYRHAILAPPEGIAQKFERSGFIHPLFSPSGQVLTWVQPPDHLHHMGIWNPWTRSTWKGVNTDFWNLASEMGTVRFNNLIGLESGSVFAECRVGQDHVAFVDPNVAATLTGVPKDDYAGFSIPGKEGFTVLTEEWIIRVWSVSKGYLLDFTSLLTNITDDKVSFDAYRYGGGIGYRATEKWNNTNSSVLTSEGKTWENGDATRARWCRIVGDLEGIQTGLLFLSDPDNYDAPQPMRIWPKNSNGGVGHQFFEFTPIRNNSWVLESGKTYAQRYRIWVYEGSVSAEEAEMAWQAYAKRPKISILYETH